MPLYCKVSITDYGSSSDATRRATLSDLKHESKRLLDKQGEGLVFETPQNWHKSVLDTLLRPEDWAPPADRAFSFKPSDVLKLCDLVEAKLRSAPTLLEVQAPIKVFGDIHGQYADLMHLFRVYGAPSRLGDISCVDYLFLGDYVDRGEHSLETICLLFALKVEFPTRVHLLRGNHEVSDVNRRYGFLAECCSRLGPEEGRAVWRRVNEVFDWLPLAARIDGRILCMHGGISNQLVSCCQIACIERPLSFNENEYTASARLAHQLLWNDPNSSDAVYGSHASSRGHDIHTFSAQQVEEFCQVNDLQLIIRAHQCVKDGFERFARGRMVTVFSAANYCGDYDNAGALLLVGRDHVVVPKLVHPEPPTPKPVKVGALGTTEARAGPLAGEAAGPVTSDLVAAEAGTGPLAAAESHEPVAAEVGAGPLAAANHHESAAERQERLIRSFPGKAAAAAAPTCEAAAPADCTVVLSKRGGSAQSDRKVVDLEQHAACACIPVAGISKASTASYGAGREVSSQPSQPNDRMAGDQPDHARLWHGLFAAVGWGLSAYLLAVHSKAKR